MIAMNRAMYSITVAEHPELKIPYFGFRGTPVGIDVHKVVATGIAPVMDTVTYFPVASGCVRDGGSTLASPP